MHLDHLCETHSHAIELAIQRTCARWHVAGPDRDDLEAELWLYMINNDCRVLRRFRGASAIGTYLFRVMNRAAGHWIRRRMIRRQCELSVREHTHFAEHLDPAPSPEVALAQAEIVNRRLQVLWTAYAHLPEVEQRVFRARWEGLRIAAIADQLGMSFKSAENHLYRAIEQLRRGVTTDDVAMNNVQANKQTNKQTRKQAK